MTKTNKKILTVLFAILVFVAVASVSTAWFVQGILSDKFKFTVAFVESKVTLYGGNDYNKDGVLDRKFGEESFEELGDSINGTMVVGTDGKPILVDGKPIYNSEVRVNFNIKDMLPTQVFTWKINIQNVGDVRGIVTADFTIFPGENNDWLDVLSASIDGGEKLYFGNCHTVDPISGTPKQVVTVIDGLILDYNPGDDVLPESMGEYVLRIEFEELENLLAAGVNINESQYNAYKNKVFSNINLYVRIEDYNKL